jgi:hypothetical protein
MLLCGGASGTGQVPQAAGAVVWGAAGLAGSQGQGTHRQGVTGLHCRTQQSGLPSCQALAPCMPAHQLVLASYVCAVVECGGSRVAGGDACGAASGMSARSGVTSRSQASATYILSNGCYVCRVVAELSVS